MIFVKFVGNKNISRYGCGLLGRDAVQSSKRLPTFVSTLTHSVTPKQLRFAYFNVYVMCGYTRSLYDGHTGQGPNESKFHSWRSYELIEIGKCLLPVQNLLSYSLLSKYVKINVYRTIILPAVLYGLENWSLVLTEKCRLRIFENRVLRMWVYEGRNDTEVEKNT